MAVKNPLVQNALSLLGYGVGVGLRSTLDVRATYADAAVDPEKPYFTGRYIYAGWHEALLMPVLMRSGPRLVGLVSESGDGEILAQLLERCGWATARGSSSRGGAAALLRFLRDDDRCPVLTVDGPRGPRRVMAMGAVYMASKIGLPMVCIGVGMDRPWRLRSWDRFAIPKPYSRARFVWGPPRHVPAGLDRDSLEAYRLRFENELNWLTGEAESWAEDGRRRAGEIPMTPGEMSPAMPYWDPAHAVRLPDSILRSWEEVAPTKSRVA
jgi:lysophospholipid acyltransferase (LPLAT)-like uncharacterized protein